MPTIGYGEDGLTFQALHAQRKGLLAKLGDKTTPEKCTVYFRPSFGRGGKSLALFGEFDAIVVTDHFLYLVESKWTEANEIPRKLTLKDVQGRRHQIFRWLFQKWYEASRIDPTINWQKFFGKYQSEFARQPYDRYLANPRTLLARNLEWILKKTTEMPRDVKNVLLYFHPSTALLPTESFQIPNFLVVLLPFDRCGESAYFELNWVDF